MAPRIGRFANDSGLSQSRGGRSKSRPSAEELSDAKRLKEEEELSASRIGYKSFEVESKDSGTAFSALTIIGPGWVSIPSQGELLVLAPQRTILELKVDVESTDQVLLLIPDGESPHVWMIGANYFATQAKDLLHGVDLHAAKHFSSLVFYRSRNGEVYTRPLSLAPVEEFKQYLHQDAQKRKVAVLKQKSNAVENQIRKIVDEEVRRSQELALRIKEIDHALREMATHTELVATRDYKLIQDDMHSLHNELDNDLDAAFQPIPSTQLNGSNQQHMVNNPQQPPGSGPLMYGGSQPMFGNNQQTQISQGSMQQPNNYAGGFNRGSNAQYSAINPSAGTLFDNGGNVMAASRPDSSATSRSDGDDKSELSDTQMEPTGSTLPPPAAQSFAQLLEQQEKTLQRQRSVLQKMLEKAANREQMANAANTPIDGASVISQPSVSLAGAPPLTLPRLGTGFGDPTVSTPEPTYKRGRPTHSLSRTSAPAATTAQEALSRQPGFIMTGSKNSSRITSSNSPRLPAKSPGSLQQVSKGLTP